MPTPSSTKPSDGAENTPLTAAEVTDERDVTPRAPGPDLSGKRVRAIPTLGATTVRLSTHDFRDLGVADHPNVEWDFRKDRFTVGVGDGEQLSDKAADVITSKFPQSFEYMGK